MTLVMNTLEDTIIAISTPAGRGGLGIVRLSGQRALAVAKKFFKPRKKPWVDVRPRNVVLGDIYNYEKKEFIDEAYLAFFAGAGSYTREDMVEISCHGSPVVLEEVVRLGIRAGARPAHPGEFTLRAYLHGRIDILQAEAVNDLISAESLEQAKISFGQVRGRLSNRIQGMRRRFVELLSQIEAAIEFPEEGLRLSPAKIARSLEAVISDVKTLVSSYERGRTLREGLTLAITGRANVGKSTLFNALLDEDRAIVSPYPGTTRDYLRETINIKDSLFHLIDMAGLERPSHPVEKESIKRSRELASRADGILLVLDSSRPETKTDLDLIRRFRDKRMILLFNKSDLAQKIDKRRCRAANARSQALEISALKGSNLNRLRDMIHDTYVPTEKFEEEVILHLRQKILLERILDCLEQGLKLLREGHSEEVCAEEIGRALPFISELTGEIRAEDVIENIFSRFCVGK